MAAKAANNPMVLTEAHRHGLSHIDHHTMQREGCNLEFVVAKAAQQLSLVPQLLSLPGILQACDDNWDAGLFIQLHKFLV